MDIKEKAIRLKKALGKTTKGPWEIKIFPGREDGFINAPEPEGRRFGYGIEIFGDDTNGYPTWLADFEFAVLAHEDLKEILDYIIRE